MTDLSPRERLLSTIECRKQDVQRAVENAFEVLAPGGGFILAPVDNVRALVETWKRLRETC